MASMPVRWKVKEYLEAHSLTPYRFMKESGLAQGTAYRLVNGDTRNLNADTLDATIRTLEALTGQPVQLSDVLEYTREG
jgi:DNA-binding Xre family transcriptional regulator